MDDYRWVPVEEELPENLVDLAVLWIDECGFPCTTTGFYRSRTQDFHNGSDIIPNVTHWLRLPPYPKGVDTKK